MIRIYMFIIYNIRCHYTFLNYPKEISKPRKKVQYFVINKVTFFNIKTKQTFLLINMANYDYLAPNGKFRGVPDNI